MDIAKQVLEQFGMQVTEIPTSNQEECDLLVSIGGCSVLVEEKLKLESEHKISARREALSNGQVHGTVEPLQYNNRLSGIVKKAAKQLSSTGSQVRHDFRLIWFTATGFDAEARHQQFMATLYGTTSIFELDKPKLRPCYFFKNSEFFRHKATLHGAVAAYLNGDTVTINLCLNPLSSSWQDLRRSEFAQKFPTGLVDPISEEAAGVAYIADTSLPRENEAAIMKYIEAKYGLSKPQSMNLKLASAVVNPR